MHIEQILEALEHEQYDIVGSFATLEHLETLYYDQSKYMESALLSLIKMQTLYHEVNLTSNMVIKQKLKEEYNDYHYCFSQNNVGIKKLIEMRHPFFLEHVKGFFDESFFEMSRMENDDLIYFLYTHGYEDVILKHLYSINLMDLHEFFKHSNILNKYFDKRCALRLNRFSSLFFNLPNEKKHLLAYIEYDWYSISLSLRDSSQNDFIKSALQEVYQNNFQGILSFSIQERILSLYGNVSAEIISFAITRTLEEKEVFWKQIDFIAQTYFDNQIYRALHFAFMYPDFLPTLLSNSSFSLEDLRRQVSLLEKSVALNVQSLSDCIDNAHYAINNVEGVIPSWLGLVQNGITEPLFSTSQEVVLIDFEGVTTTYPVDVSHIATLKQALGKEHIMESTLFYEGCMQGIIIILIENGMLQFFLPPTLSRLQKEEIESHLRSFDGRNLSSFITIGCSYALPNRELEFISLNQQDVMNLQTFHNSLQYFLIDDEGKYLNRNGKLF